MNETTSFPTAKSTMSASSTPPNSLNASAAVFTTNFNKRKCTGDEGLVKEDYPTMRKRQYGVEVNRDEGENWVTVFYSAGVTCSALAWNESLVILFTVHFQGCVLFYLLHLYISFFCRLMLSALSSMHVMTTAMPFRGVCANQSTKRKTFLSSQPSPSKAPKTDSTWLEGALHCCRGRPLLQKLLITALLKEFAIHIRWMRSVHCLCIVANVITDALRMHFDFSSIHPAVPSIVGFGLARFMFFEC